jgi:hypothetical protein
MQVSVLRQKLVVVLTHYWYILYIKMVSLVAYQSCEIGDFYLWFNVWLTISTMVVMGFTTYKIHIQ